MLVNENLDVSAGSSLALAVSEWSRDVMRPLSLVLLRPMGQ